MTEDANRALFLDAIAHHQAGRTAEAEAGYRAVLNGNPRVVAAHNNLGLLLRARGQSEEATVCFRAALDLRPDHVEAWNNLGILRRQNHATAEAEA